MNVGVDVVSPDQPSVRVAEDHLRRPILRNRCVRSEVCNLFAAFAKRLASDTVTVQHRRVHRRRREVGRIVVTKLRPTETSDPFGRPFVLLTVFWLELK